MAQPLVEHLAAVKSYLTSLQKSKSLSNASSVQKAAFENKLKAAPLSLSDASAVTEAAKAVPWAGNDLENVIEIIANCVGAAPASVGYTRSKLQDFENLTHYGTDKVWSTMRSDPANAMDALSDHLCALGLRNPSEPTMQKATAVFLLATEGKIKTLTLPQGHLNTILKALKKVVKARGKGEPHVYIEKLPASPVDYQTQFPVMFAAIFASARPVSCPFASDDVSTVASNIPMRSTKKVTAPTLDMGLGNSMATVAQNMFAQMAAMQEQQHRMLEMMTGASSSLGQRGRLNLSLPVSAPTPPLALAFTRQRCSSRLALTSSDDRIDAKIEVESSDDAEQPSGEDKIGSGLPEAASNKPKKQSVADACGYILQVMGAKAESKADKKDAKEAQKATARTASNGDQEKKEDQELEKEQPVMKRPSARSNADGDEDGELVPKRAKASAPKQEKAPYYGIEWSRNQVLCRSGLTGPGQTQAFKFQPGEQEPAMKKAEAWVRKKCLERGLPPSP